jgi:hypothetical protein
MLNNTLPDLNISKQVLQRTSTSFSTFRLQKDKRTSKFSQEISLPQIVWSLHRHFMHWSSAWKVKEHPSTEHISTQLHWVLSTGKGSYYLRCSLFIVRRAKEVVRLPCAVLLLVGVTVKLPWGQFVLWPRGAKIIYWQNEWVKWLSFVNKLLQVTPWQVGRLAFWR